VSELQQSCYTSGGTSPYCALQDRPINYTNTTAANAVTAWYTTVINISEIKTNGLDFELNYNTEIAGRPFSFRGFAAWQPDIKYIQPAVPTVDQAGVTFGNAGIVASPKWRLTGMIGYAPAEWLRLDFQYRWRTALKLWGSGEWVNNRIPAYGVAALNASVRPKQNVMKDLELFFNVQNLFDAEPAPANASNSANAPGGNNGFALFDDVLGRSYTMGVRVRF
jgi:outer membrane receptor protein involved in Fe transport